MKKILITLLLIPSLAFAGPEVTENDLITDPKSGNYILGRMNEDASVITATEGDAIAPSLNSMGQLMCSINAGVAAATNPVKPEDSPHTSGDVGFPAFGIRNDSIAVTTGTDLDYQLQSFNDRGVAYTALIDGTTSAWKAEDVAAADGSTLFMSGFVREDALTQNTNASGDNTWAKTDALGRLVTTAAPAGETWQSCATGITNTARSAVKAAVASNRIYVASLMCGNSSAVPTFVTLEDGTTQVGTGYLKAGDSLQWIFPVPLRGTSNTAFNVSLGTTATATNCCAAGYISVN